MLTYNLTFIFKLHSIDNAERGNIEVRITQKEERKNERNSYRKMSRYPDENTHNMEPFLLSVHMHLLSSD